MRQNPKIGLIVLGVFVLIVLFIVYRREAPAPPTPTQSSTPQQSPKPQPSPEPEQTPEPRPSPARRQSPAPAPPQQPPEPQPELQPTPEPQEPHARTVTEVRSAATLLEEYKTRTGAYPTTAQGLAVIGAAIKDPWGNDYIYQSPSTRGREAYDLFSAGPDHVPDTPDDDWGESENSSE